LFINIDLFFFKVNEDFLIINKRLFVVVVVFPWETLFFQIVPLYCMIINLLIQL